VNSEITFEDRQRTQGKPGELLHWTSSTGTSFVSVQPTMA